MKTYIVQVCQLYIDTEHEIKLTFSLGHISTTSEFIPVLFELDLTALPDAAIPQLINLYYPSVSLECLLHV